MSNESGGEDETGERSQRIKKPSQADLCAVLTRGPPNICDDHERQPVLIG
jgi:hypothetical protein